MVTAGNTGAAMIAAKMVIGTVAGVDRPALAAVLPNPTARTVLLDVGANVDTKPLHLREFAVMGHFYAQEVIGTPSPRIGLMSIGEEEGKGTDLTREVFKVLKSTGLNFIGNVEGRDVFNGSVGRDRLRRLRGQRGAQERRVAGRAVPAACCARRSARAPAPRLAYVLAKPAFDRLPRAHRLQRVRRGAAARPQRRLLHRPWPLQRPRGPERHPPGRGVLERPAGPQDLPTRSPSCTARRSACGPARRRTSSGWSTPRTRGS